MPELFIVDEPDLLKQAQDLEQERDDLLYQVHELDAQVQSLKAELKEAQTSCDDAMARVECLEAQLCEPSELMDAARKLLKHLEVDLGPERWDEMMPTYVAFRAMDDLRDALREPSSALSAYAREHNLKYLTQVRR